MCTSVFKVILIACLFILGSTNAAALPKCSDLPYKDNCIGSQTNPDGSFYQGGFKANKYSGKGELTLLNGAKYVGDFENGLQNGRGYLTLPSGNTYDGEWRNGFREGYGIFIYKNTGARYEGTWLNGNQKDGVLKNPDNSSQIFGKGLNENGNQSIDFYKNKCRDLGFKPETESFAKCVLQLSK